MTSQIAAVRRSSNCCGSKATRAAHKPRASIEALASRIATDLLERGLPRTLPEMNSLILAAFVLTWLVILTIGFLLLGALRNQTILTWRLEQLALTTPSRINRNGLKLGVKAPDFALPDSVGRTVSLEDFAGRKIFLTFTQSGCGPCETIVPALEDLQKKGQFAGRRRQQRRPCDHPRLGAEAESVLRCRLNPGMSCRGNSKPSSPPLPS